MAAYAALLSLAQTTHPNKTQHRSLFSYHVQKKLTSIHDYVNFLILFFDEFPQKVNRWEVRIRDVSYKIEDNIETFMWQKIQHDASFVDLEDQLESVMVEIGLITGEVLEERPAYLPASSSSKSSPRLATAGIDAVIGLDDDIIAINERLCGQSSDLQVIPIVGMAGIGKTTIARTLYDDPLIFEHFDICAWVVVSQDYSPHRFRKILSDSFKLFEEQMSGDEMDDAEIALKVFQYLKKRRYFVVIDDVWGTHVWDDVRDMFPNDENGSRIMLTTRQMDVAAYPDSDVHEMQFLNDSQSWDLLKQKVFKSSDCPPELEDIGKEIARRCAGLPLAVVLVAGVLKTQASWKEIAKNVNPVVGRELEKILLLSYTYLPHHLRPCFLLTGGFPEDVNIPTSRLIRLWVSDGFVKHQDGCSKSLEEKAEEYLENLVQRNLVVVTGRKSDGKIKSCSLHDMVRELCINIGQEEKFLHVINGPDHPQGLMNERRISFRCSHVGTIWGSTFRTILCFQIQNVPNWLARLGSYTLLRELDVLVIDLNELPSQVFELYHLRYLALMGSFSIPSALSNLARLQTLIIHLASGKLRGRHNGGVTHTLPLEIWRLPQLRHLLFHAPYRLPHPPEGLNLPLENLQTLSLVANFVWNERIVQLIPNVKTLGLTYSVNREYHLHHLKDLHQLEKLEVVGYFNFSWKGKSPSFPCTLKKLTLVGGDFPWEDMAIVGSLPNLEILKLLGDACVGKTWETTDEEFPRLNFLLIDESHLQQWITQSNPFPTLKRLVLRSCLYLREIPEMIGEIPTLELIEVAYCTNSLLESAKKIKEDQESNGNDTLQVRVGREDIQSFFKCMDQFPSRPATSGNDALVGLEKDLMAIKHRLCGMSSELQVVPIVGMRGIGKTTLGRAVYNNPTILEHFEIRAWVPLSPDYRLELGKIIRGLFHSMELLEEHVSAGEIDESEMLTKVHKNLMGRRYLVVMDDVRIPRKWDGFSKIFPNDGNGSRIMLTATLKQYTAHSYAGYGFFLHPMQLMGHYQSWDLLKRKVFENRNCPPELEEIGKDIVLKCAGLPSGIVLIAGILSAVDKTRASWNEIFENINERRVLSLDEIVNLSFRQLPHHLRLCLQCMAEYEKSIHASDVIKLWIDKGLLKHEKGCKKSLEEKGEEYLEDLVKRNLVTVTSRKSDGRIESCSLHHIIRDYLCRLNAENERLLQLQWFSYTYHIA